MKLFNKKMSWAFFKSINNRRDLIVNLIRQIICFPSTMLELISSKITILEWMFVLRRIQQIPYVHLLSLYKSNTTCFYITRFEIDFYLFSIAYTHHLGNCCAWYCHCPDLSSLTRQNIKADFASDKKGFLENWYSNENFVTI